MEISPIVKNCGAGDSATVSHGAVRPLYKGIILGVIIGVVYCWSTRDIAAEVGVWTSFPGLVQFQSAADNLTTSFNNSQRPSDGAPIATPSFKLTSYDAPAAEDTFFQERINWIRALWEASPLLNNSRNASTDPLVEQAQRELGHLKLRPPHLEDCAARYEEYKRLDSRNVNGSRPVWSLWKGQVGTIEHPQHVQVEETEDILGVGNVTAGPFPPWVEGGDEDNMPMTRRVQRDIWLHQHPRNCSHESVRFLLTDWVSSRRFGLGAQLVHAGGLLSIAMRDNRVLVLEKLDRANHGGCQGSGRASWSCYFLAETSQECRMRARELARKNSSDERLMSGEMANSRGPWSGVAPKLWGRPWEDLQPTTEIDGHLLVNYKMKEMRFWRSQSVRYFTRFPSEYTCLLMNKARHDAWGVKAATVVLQSTQMQEPGLPPAVQQEADMEKWIWTSQKPWIPRPLLSVHVRLGDKGSEMKLMGFDAYMALAIRLRLRFPQVQNIWLSSEMQSVIDESKNYSGWNFYYTDVPRQVGNTSMHKYEAGMGKERSMTNSVVNFLMATDADFFIGALGSTWCYLIDGIRSTEGKQMAGYLSVNKDRFWR